MSEDILEITKKTTKINQKVWNKASKLLKQSTIVSEIHLVRISTKAITKGRR